MHKLLCNVCIWMNPVPSQLWRIGSNLPQFLAPARVYDWKGRWWFAGKPAQSNKRKIKNEGNEKHEQGTWVKIYYIQNDIIWSGIWVHICPCINCSNLASSFLIMNERNIYGRFLDSVFCVVIGKCFGYISSFFPVCLYTNHASHHRKTAVGHKLQIWKQNRFCYVYIHPINS